MKTIQFRVSDEEHTAIKVEAAKRGVSIKEYMLHPAVKAIVEAAPPEYQEHLLEPLKEIIQPSPQEKMDSMQPEQVPDSWRQATFGMGKPMFKKGNK